ncbi:MAG: molecular chaperone GrpE [Candidatus Midichloriaceae bacterium]
MGEILLNSKLIINFLVLVMVLFDNEKQEAKDSKISEEIEDAVESQNPEVIKEEENQESEIEKLKKEIDSYKDFLIREKAENQNLRKRFQKELEDAHKYAVSNFIKDMSDSIEDLFRALENVKEEDINSNEMLKSLFDGVNMTKNNMLKVLNKFNIKRINPLGEAFHHDFHQVISQVEGSGEKKNTILTVVQAGYTIQDRLLKPAMVIIAK